MPKTPTEQKTSPNEEPDENHGRTIVPARNGDEAQVIRLGGDEVIQATAELPEDQRETIRWLFSLAKHRHWSLARLETETGIDDSTLFRVFRGTYAAKLDSIVARIAAYRNKFQDVSQRTGKLFVPTSISKKIWAACDFARSTRTMAFVYGRTHIGKSDAQLAYMAQPVNNHGKTKYVRLPASAGVQLMMKEFARACFVNPNSCFENLREYVLNAIDETHLLLVDELHEVFLSYQRGSAIKCLEVIREIHDRRGCGMVLFGTQKLKEELMMGQHLDLLAQFKERGILEVQLPSALPKKDLKAIAAHFHLDDPSGLAAEIVQEVTKDHGFKRYVLFLESGQNLARGKKERFTWDHFVQAHDIVKKLGGES
jgi:DNA transposition AAA+ family ATPase